jgi:hypothetical protein
MGKQHHVGRYYSEVEAARAFDRAALCIYGEMAITNFGLDAARADPSPVSAHILMVKRVRHPSAHVHMWHAASAASGSPQTPA